MKGNAWLVFLTTAALEFGVIFVSGWAIWIDITPEQRAFVAGLWISYAGMPILAALLLLVLLGLGVHLMFRWYITPLRALSEDIRVIAISNPGFRLTTEGSRPELRELVDSLNLLAQHYQASLDDIQTRIQQANAALEEEKNTLAALMSKLTQGVVVCNRDGRILLYNRHAQGLLADSAGWIGLGRSIFSLLDKNLILHALAHLDHHLSQGESRVMAPFAATRPGGQMLSVHLAPVLDKENKPTGYILTLEDITHRTETDSRRGVLLQSLTEGQRSAIAGIRAAIETILAYPEMEQAQQYQFETVIRDEAIKLSRYLDRIGAEYAEEFKASWPLEKMLGSDLLAMIEHRLGTELRAKFGISAPLEPLWLTVDSYTLVQAIAFVIQRLLAEYQAQEPELKLASQPPFVCLQVSWRGRVLDMETLRAWGKQPITRDTADAPTLHDVIDRHGGAVWSQAESALGRRSLRLLLPAAVGDGTPTPTERVAEQGHDYDFGLFRRTSQTLALKDSLLTELNYTVLDTETTGLAPSQGDEIIAIGAVRVVNGRILRREMFDFFVNPQRPIAEAAMAIHGITPQMLFGMPTIGEVLPRFLRFAEDTVLIGHNVAFDMRFFEIKERSLGIKIANPVLDTLLLAAVVHPNQEEQSLEAIAARLGVCVTGRHTALGDALTTAQVFLALLPLLAEQGIRTLGQAQVACENTEYARVKY